MATTAVRVAQRAPVPQAAISVDKTMVTFAATVVRLAATVSAQRAPTLRAPTLRALALQALALQALPQTIGASGAAVMSGGEAGSGKAEEGWQGHRTTSSATQPALTTLLFQALTHWKQVQSFAAPPWELLRASSRQRGPVNSLQRCRTSSTQRGPFNSQQAEPASETVAGCCLQRAQSLLHGVAATAAAFCAPRGSGLRVTLCDCVCMCAVYCLCLYII